MLRHVTIMLRHCLCHDYVETVSVSCLCLDCACVTIMLIQCLCHDYDETWYVSWSCWEGAYVMIMFLKLCLCHDYVESQYMSWSCWLCSCVMIMSFPELFFIFWQSKICHHHLKYLNNIPVSYFSSEGRFWKPFNVEGSRFEFFSRRRLRRLYRYILNFFQTVR